MAIMRIHKNKNYTVMSNYHFKEKNMSLKAKGLLSQMLSLPDDWDYSIAGLVAINKENETSIKSTLDELKKFKYLAVTKLLPNETKSGRLEYVYDIYEKPYEKQEVEKQRVEKQGVEFLGVEFLGVENQGQLNTNKLNTDKLNIKKQNNNNINKDDNTKISFGEYKRIKLTQKQYNNLCDEFNKNFIDNQIMLLDEYVQSNDNKNKYKDFNIVIRKSIRENWFNKGGNNNTNYKESVKIRDGSEYSMYD